MFPYSFLDFRCAECEAGTFTSTSCNMCEKCPMNSYNSSGASICMKCPIGTYTSAEGSKECLLLSEKQFVVYNSVSIETKHNETFQFETVPNKLEINAINSVDKFVKNSSTLNNSSSWNLHSIAISVPLCFTNSCLSGKLYSFTITN
jgi:hypothetical protein